MVHQPVLHSHDTWVTKPVVVPYASHVRHVATYKGVPHEEIFMHGIGTGAFGKSHVPVAGTRRNKIDGVKNKNQTGEEETSDQAKNPEKQVADDAQQRRAGNPKLRAGQKIVSALTDSLVGEQLKFESNKNPVGAGTRIQRSLPNLIPLFGDQLASAYSSKSPLNVQRHDQIPEVAVGAASRIQRSIEGAWNPYIKPQTRSVTTPLGAGARIKRALEDLQAPFEGEKPYEMYKRSYEETENFSTPDENADKNTNSTKKTLLIIRRPPILYHPPSHMIHRPSIVVHRPDIIVHRHPIVFHRPPILVHRPPIIIHRRPVLIHRPPIIVHRPPLVFHRPPIIIHRRPYIIHHHPILFHRPAIIIHKGPQMIVHHSHLIHHYPMHMIHMHCPGCGFGKSTVARLEDNTTEHNNKKTPHSDRSLKDSTVKDSKGKSSNKPKRSVADKKSKTGSKEANHQRKRKDAHKKKKDVVVNRPPIIYHPPPEVYHRPDIVVHRAPILIHRPPIVYHQPPVVVHRPAVVYHQPPIVFHQPAPAVNQPLLFSHDSFVVHPMAFASHMGSVVNDAGHYVGLPHGGVTNFPGSIPHGPTGHVFPALNSPNWARRTEVLKPQHEKQAKGDSEKHGKHQSDLKGDQNVRSVKRNVKATVQKSKYTKGERKNKVIVARPPMIYHPPPEIYDRPDIIVHRPDIVIHRPSIVYHQPSVVIHRAPVVYQQPPVVFHQPSPMVTQPVYHAHDTYVAHAVFHPHVSNIAHAATYVGAPHVYPGHNDYGWGLSAHTPTVQIPQYGYAANYRAVSSTNGYSAYGPAIGRSRVENSTPKENKRKDKEKHNKDSTLKKEKTRKRRSAQLSKRHFHHHHYHYHHHHHRHGHHHRGSKRFYHLRPISSFAHRGHRKHVVIIHRPPLIYHPPAQVYRQPDILMHLPPLVYHRPAIMFQQPPTIVHHPSIIYHQPPVVFHNPPPIIHSPVIHSHQIITPHLQHVMVPSTSYVHPAGTYFGPVVAGPAYGKSHIERTDSEKDRRKSTSVPHLERKYENAKFDEKRETSTTPETKTDSKGSKKQNVDVVVHQPPIVYHPPPDIFDKPAVVMHPPPMVVHRPPILIHRAPLVVHRPPVIIHRPPIVLHHPTPVYHVVHGHFFHPMSYAMGRSTILKESSKISKKDKQSAGEHDDKKSATNVAREKSKTRKGERKNLVVVHRPPMIYHPPPEIYDRPDVIVHRPDIVVHRPSVVYHQPSVVVHRPSIIYRQPPIVFHQPPPMIHQPIMHAHDTYLAHTVPVPYISQVHHAATYVGAPHFFHQPHFGGFVGHAFGKSVVEKVKKKTLKQGNENKGKKVTHNGDKTHRRSTRDAVSEKKANESSSETSTGLKKNKVIIARPPMIYHPPPEIYDRPNIIVHRPDIVIHRPSIVYHQPSVVVHRPPIIYRQPAVVFHQPPPLVHQPIMHAHDTYVAHPVAVPYSSHIQHASTYVGSPHYYPGGWNYGWSQLHSFGPAYGKSKVPTKNSNSSKHESLKSVHKGKVRRATKNDQGKNDKEAKPKSAEKSKKKNQVVIQRPPLIYHPPAEVYHKPNVIMHRPDIVIHRPSVVYHQPSVVIHRPPVIYQQPPVVFHQPSPMVRQPVLHAHDTYLAHPYFTPYSSNVYDGGNYVGAPHFFHNGWGWRGPDYGFGHAFGKSKVEKSHKKHAIHLRKGKGEIKGDRRTLQKEEKAMEDTMRLKNETKTATKGNKKNLVIMRRPPLIYHPPPEVYHKPDVIMHRPDIVIHRPSIVFHQPSVVVHRPPVIYHQPPVVFHQPSPMVHQPILHSHDTYLAHPHFVPFTSHLHHSGSYVGAPHFYPSNWGWEAHGYGSGFPRAFGKSKVEKASKHERKNETEEITETEGNKRTLQSTNDDTTNGKSKSKKDATKGHKKNLVVLHRPPLIYHPPPEIYHKPDIIVHRPDLVIHRPSVVFHQPSVVVHRPPVIYHQPPVVFHQPSPMVHQPIFHSHETYFAHPHFVPYLSRITHAGSYVGAPHFYPGHWGLHHGFGHFMGHAFGKSKVEKGSRKGKFETSKKRKTATPSHSEDNSSNRARRATKEPEMHGKSEVKKRKHNKDVSEKAEIKTLALHPQEEDKKHHKNGHKKNMVIIQRPTLVYHPPPEIYDRPNIIVHRPDFVIHQPSVVYHQPSVVVHRPPIIYNPPPVVFHQPAPMVHQPMYTAHDIYHSHPHFVPYASHVRHAHTYVGAPHYYAGGWRYGYGFSDNSLADGWNGYRGPLVPPSTSYGTNYFARTPVASRRFMRGPYSLAFSKSIVQKNVEKPKDPSKTHENHDKQKNNTQSHHSLRKGARHPRSAESRRGASRDYHPVKSGLHKKRHRNGDGGKKNLVIMRRPTLIYHPPPEVYHKPDIIMHRPDIVIHRPSVVYHQPSVMVHRPPIIYRQPPVVFHQPSPMVHQPIFHAHESYMAHPAFVPYASQIQHTGTYMGAPTYFHGGWNYGYGHAFGKSHVFKHKSKSPKKNKKSEKKNKIESTKRNMLHPQEEKDERATRKNDIVVSRPPIIYHPPPEIYHRPDIVVHRAPIVLHRPPIIYHQPPVVVHRPAVVYHQPPIVFHQPPPTVNQPILHSHDSFVLRPAARFLPQGSTVTHSMSYVGIPNHVVHGDELDFHHFHRSQIEHSGHHRSSQKPFTAQIAKSTISKTPTTNKENTETTITDQTQKKTLRSTVQQHTLSKRQLMGSHSLYGPVSPLNDIEDLHKSIEQKEKLSTIPGKTSNRQSEVARRSDESSYEITKRQIIVPDSTENVFHNSLPSVYNALDAPTFQNQVLAEPEVLPHSNGIRIEHLPGFASSVRDIQELAGAGIARSSFPLSLQQYLPTTQKEDSPDVRVHVETTKSSIPVKKREKRQIFPIYQQQGPAPLPRVLYQPPSLGDLGVVHTAAPSSVYNLFSPYHQAFHTITGPLHYLPFASQLHHRPRVNINVQSARSTIPDMEHVLEKQSKESRPKRQLLAVVPPISGLHGLEEARTMNTFIPYSRYSPLPRFFFPPLPHPRETEAEETSYPEALPLFHPPAQPIHNLFSILPEDDGGESPTFNPLASYLSALYHNVLGYPPYYSHRKPKVHVDVQASKSHIPKANKMEKKQDVHSRPRISKRQLYNYLPNSGLTSHYTLPTALNYGVQGFPFHRNSPRININVETAKKNGIPSITKQRRSPKVGYTKHLEEHKTGDKRDELIGGGENGQEINQNQDNPEFSNAPENQFVATSEAPREEGDTSNEQLQGQAEAAQQQQYREMVGQRQDLEQNSVQEVSPSQGQPMMMPAQAQQLAFRGSNAPLPAPIQQPPQAPLQAPFQAQVAVPFQGMLSSGLPGASVLPVSDQSVPQQAIQTEEEQPKHTTINVNVAAKSTVPKKHFEKIKNTLHKRQFVASTQGLIPAYGIPIPYNGAATVPSNSNRRVSINVQTTKKSAVEKDHNKRQSISLLTRFPAMQVLPQTFKQNGILMPAFNTLPVNHRIKANGMLLEELQRQRKYKIPKMGHKRQTGLRSKFGQSAEMGKSQQKQKENAKKRQFYVVPQSPVAGQRYPLALQLAGYQRPRVSVNVDVSKRKSAFPGRKRDGLLSFKSVKRRLPSFAEKLETKENSKSKRQVYGIDQLPHMIHLPVVSPPLLSQVPSLNERPRVSVHVETAKKKNKLLRQNEPNKKERRQIYGLSELPHEGLPFPAINQGQALEYLPSTVHTPRVSVNVEASKRSDEEGSHDLINKRQVFGVQAPPAQPFEQAQEPIVTVNDQEPRQSDEPTQGSFSQSPIHVQEEPQQDQLSTAAINSNPAPLQQQQAQELSSDAVPSQAGVNQIDYERPHVSVHVEASKRSNDKRKAGFIEKSSFKRNMPQLHQFEQEPEDYEPDVNEPETISNTGTLPGDERPRVSVKVDVTKKKHDIAATASRKKFRTPVKRQLTMPFNEGSNTIQGNPIQNTQFMTGENQEENQQGVQQISMLPQPQSELPEQQQQQQQPQQEQQQQIMQPLAFVQPVQQQQQIQPFQTAVLPLEHKTPPKVSISVQTAKSLISANSDRGRSFGHHKERTPERKLRRQLFGTVPLLSSLGQTAVTGSVNRENGRSTIPKSTKGIIIKENHIQVGRKDKSAWKRQLYNYLGGQQDQQILPAQSLQSISEPQQEQTTIQPIQAFQQDSSAQLTQMNIPQASLMQTNDQEASQPYLAQTADNQQGSVLATQTQESSVSPINTLQRPHVSINVQTAKSLVPNPERKVHGNELKTKVPRSHVTTGKVHETKKFKRQFDLLRGGVIERRRGPKFVPEPLKKPREENLFGLGNNLNKPVEVFTDPISNLVAGGAAGRKRPKLGGIRLDSPTGVGALPLKGAANSLEGTLPSDLGAQAILQDSPAETAPPLAQEPGVTSEPLFRPPSGIAGPQLDTLEREGANNIPLADLPSTGPAILPLPAINRALLPNLPLPAAPLPQGNPLLLAPRMLPILPFAPPMAVPPVVEPPTIQETTPEPSQAPPPLAPMLPPVIPMPVPNIAPVPVQPSLNSQAPPPLAPMLPPVIPMPVPNIAPVPAQPSLFPQPEEDKPSVHVNVETSRSNVPVKEQHSTQHANGSANRG